MFAPCTFATLLAAILALSSPRSSVQATQPAVTTTVVDGGSIVTDLGFGRKVNEFSTLHRQFVMINHPSGPAQLEGSGVATSFSSDDRAFLYRAVGTIQLASAVTAIELRYVLFDVFGAHMRTLSATYIRDFKAGATLQVPVMGFRWTAWDNEASEMLIVVSFVANVRTADGKVWHFDQKALLAELNRIQVSASAGVLEPTKVVK